jgi:hypothetical protein
MADGQGFTGQGPEREPASLIAGNYEIENPVFSPVWGQGKERMQPWSGRRNDMGEPAGESGRVHKRKRKQAP